MQNTPEGPPETVVVVAENEALNCMMGFPSDAAS
jgi:hypothetical protein